VQLGVDGKTVTDWYNFVREVCSEDMIANPMQIGGPGTTVAIDESVVAKAKPGNIHARPVPQQWVFGGVQLGTDRFFIELVPQRNAATLFADNSALYNAYLVRRVACVRRAERHWLCPPDCESYCSLRGSGHWRSHEQY